jgi:nucleoid-associated protein YgaU
VSPVPPAATALVTSSPADSDPVGTGAAPATRVVRQGDSLWSLAAERLGPGATAAEVAAEWPRWWERNRDVVGDDPDVLHPGQVLHLP